MIKMVNFTLNLFYHNFAADDVIYQKKIDLYTLMGELDTRWIIKSQSSC